MTIGRVKPAGWTTGTKLTSPEISDLDRNVAKAVDRTAAGDTISGALTFEAGASAQIDDGAELIVLESGNVRLEDGAHMTAESGSEVAIAPGAELIVEGEQTFPSGSVLTQELDSTATFAGAVTVDNITATGTTKYKLASRSPTRIVQSHPLFTSLTPNWDCQGSGRTYNQIATGVSRIAFPIDVPNGATITQIEVYLEGASGHGALPAVMPTARLDSVLASTGASTTHIAAVTDASADVTAYEAAHTITLAGSVIADKTTRRYYASVSGENSTDATTGLVIYAVAVTFTTAAQDDGAA